MEFTTNELEMIKFSMEYLHDADLSNMEKEDIKTIEEIMDKLGMKYSSQL